MCDRGGPTDQVSSVRRGRRVPVWRLGTAVAEIN